MIVAVLALAAAVGGACAGCHPTGTAGPDAIYSAALAALVTVAAARASRASVLILATVAAAMSRGWLVLPAGVALALAFAAVFLRRSHQRLGALTGALAIQVVLRWPAIGFHGVTALVAVAAIVPVLWSAWARQRRQWRRALLLGAAALFGLAVVLSLPVVIGNLLARSPANHGIAATRQALTAISAGDSASAALELRTATGALEIANDRTGAWWTRGGLLVPVIAQQRRATADATAAARTLTAAAAREAFDLDFHHIAYRDGQVDLNAIRALASPLGALESQVIAAQRSLAPAGSAWLVAPVANRLDHLSAELAKARSSASLGLQAAQVVPGLLGGSGVRHYFVAFMNPAETRGLDGLIGAYGELTADNGRITLTRSGPVDDLITALGPTPPQLTGLSEYLARYGVFDPGGHFQDVTYSPDFPTVDKVISELYPHAGGDPIDGVLALDPETLSVLLRFTGPLAVPGLTVSLSAANATDVLLRQQYISFPTPTQQAVRHDFLLNVLQAAVEKLSSGSLPNPQTLSTTLGPVVHQGRMLFWSNHPTDQPFLRRLGLAGAFPQPGPTSDVLAVTISNAANNKIDAYLQEQLFDRVTYDPDTGHVEATVTLTFHNGAPSHGLPSEVIGSYPGSGVPSGTNDMWLSLYSPLALDASTANDQLLALSPGIPELGVTAYSTFLHVPAESTATLALTFEGNISPGEGYRLTLRLQPLANPPVASATVQPAPGWTLAQKTPSSWQANTNEVQTHDWRFIHSR